MMTKRAIPFMVVFCMLISLVFTGCGDTKTASETDTGSNLTSDTSSSSDASSDVSSDVSSSEDISSDTQSTPSSEQSQSSQTSTPQTKPKPVESTGTDTQPTVPTTNSDAQEIKVYTHNVCSHGDQGSSGGLGSNPKRLPGICNSITENAPNVVVLVECNTLWSKSIAKTCGYERAENTRTGLSEIQILYKADEFELVENTVDNSTRSAYHWVILKSKKTSQQFMVYGYHGTTLSNTAEQDRIKEVQNMLALAAEKNLPAVLKGDFNATRESEEYKLTEKLFANPALTAELKYDGPTHLGWNSSSRSTIDHLLYSKDKFTAKVFTVLDQNDSEGTILSDHCAILATLEMKK